MREESDNIINATIYYLVLRPLVMSSRLKGVWLQCIGILPRSRHCWRLMGWTMDVEAGGDWGGGGSKRFTEGI